MIDYAVLSIAVLATAGLAWTLGSAVVHGSDRGDAERTGALLLVLAYAVAELVPSRFLALTPTIDLASGVLTLALLVLGLGLLFGRSILDSGS